MAGRLIKTLAVAALVGAVVAGGASSATRVIGGTAIQIQAAPWTVFVSALVGSVEHECTGSVIDASHVLTAAHCLYYGGSVAPPAAVTVEAGVSNVVSPSPTDLEQDRSVSLVRVHPGYVYSPTAMPDDVAVLVLAAPLDLSGPAVQAVALPAASAPFPHQAVVGIAGFGLEDPAAPDASGALESMTATVDWQGNCGDYTGTELVTSDNGIVLCEASPTSSICEGDSGAGMVNTNGPPTLVGVVNASADGCPIGGHDLAAYVGAPEILSFIEGNGQPPTAPRGSAQTTAGLTWAQPLVAGDTVVCSSTGWPGPVQLTYTFLDGELGYVLQSGPSGRYVLPATARGLTVDCEAAATNSGGTTVLYTIYTPTIKRAPQVKIVPPAPLAAAPGHVVTLRVVLESPPGLSGAFSVCAVPPASVGAHVCRSTREPFGVSGKFAFLLPLKIKPTAPLGAAHVAIHATAGLSTATTRAAVRIAKR